MAGRRATLLIAGWSSLVPATYFVLAGDIDSYQRMAGAAAVLGLALVNGWMSRISAERVVSPRVGTLFATAEILLLTVAWDRGGQGSIELLTSTVALLALAIVGLRLGEVLSVALALVAMYLVIV